MSRRHLARRTPEQIALATIEGDLSLEEAAIEFCSLDWLESGLSYLVPEAVVVEQLATNAPANAEERADLEAKVRVFFWKWLEDATRLERDNPVPVRTYPL